jgi:hypothetical protein
MQLAVDAMRAEGSAHVDSVAPATPPLASPCDF